MHGPWNLMGLVPKGEILSRAIFICYCFLYLTFVWLQDIFITSVFHLPSSNLLLHPMIFQTHFVFPSSIFHSISYFNSSFTYFCIPYSTLCSFVPSLLLSFQHLSIIPCLAFPTLTTWHSIPCDSVSHLFTFSILHCLLYYYKSCSIKFFPICTYFPSL